MIVEKIRKLEREITELERELRATCEHDAGTYMIYADDNLCRICDQQVPEIPNGGAEK